MGDAVDTIALELSTSGKTVGHLFHDGQSFRLSPKDINTTSSWLPSLARACHQPLERLASKKGVKGTWFVRRETLEPATPEYWPELAFKLSKMKSFEPQLTARPVAEPRASLGHALVVPTPMELLGPLHHNVVPEDAIWGKQLRIADAFGVQFGLWEERMPGNAGVSPFFLIRKHRTAVENAIAELITTKHPRWLFDPWLKEHDYTSQIDKWNAAAELSFPEPAKNEAVNDYFQRVIGFYKRFFELASPMHLASALQRAIRESSEGMANEAVCVADDVLVVFTGVSSPGLVAGCSQNCLAMRIRLDQLAIYEKCFTGLKRLAVAYGKLLAAYAPAHGILSRNHEVGWGSVLWSAFRSYINPWSGLLRWGVEALKDRKDRKVLERLDDAITRYWDHLQGFSESEEFAVLVEPARQLNALICGKYLPSLVRFTIRGMVEQYVELPVEKRPEFAARILYKAGVFPQQSASVGGAKVTDAKTREVSRLRRLIGWIRRLLFRRGSEAEQKGISPSDKSDMILLRCPTCGYSCRIARKRVNRRQITAIKCRLCESEASVDAWTGNIRDGEPCS